MEVSLRMAHDLCVDTAPVGGGISRSSGCQIGFHEIGKATHDYKRMISTSWKPVCAAGASDAEADFFGFCLESCVAHALGCAAQSICVE